MPWDKIERIYNKSLRNQHSGGGNKPARMVIGALIIKHKMNLSDEETIWLIAENPYMQYFIGLEELTGKSGTSLLYENGGLIYEELNGIIQ